MGTTARRPRSHDAALTGARLAVIDGHTLTRYGLRELVAQHPGIQLVAECGSAADAQGALEAARPDVVTVEIDLPDGDGLRLARELRDRFADLGIAILTSQGQDDVLLRFRPAHPRSAA